jgi:hypothetical protein
MEKLKETLCCGQPASIEPAEQNGKKGFGIFCSTDHEYGIFGEDRESVIRDFSVNARKQESNNGGNKVVNNNSRGLVISPKNMPKIFESKKAEMAIISSPILTGDTTAMARFVNNNIERYPLALKGAQWDKIWATPEGQASINKGIEDSFIDCVELGVTGDLVPFGKVCVLIPSVESFIFILTHGKNAPFVYVNIECVYEGDDYSDGRTRKDGFFIDFHKFAKSRKKVVKVAVYGEVRESGFIIGEMYDAERLLEKAEEHSQPYANYMKKIKAYEYQKSEGNVSRDKNGREFFKYYEVAGSDDDKYFDRSVDFFRNAESNNQLFKEGNREYAKQVISPTFTKKIYRDYIEGGETETTIFLDTLKNPYAGADQPELLIKTAGKSFLRKYKKVRNTGAAMEEVKSSKGAMKQSADFADSQFSDDVIDGEVD